MITETLYKKDNNDSIRVWTLTAVDDGLVIEHGVLGGAIQEKFEEVPYGKVNRSQDEQIISRFWSRYNKQMDKGYVPSLDIARSNKAVNSLGLKQPMLAHEYKKVGFESSVFIQRKYDGNRCIIHHHPVNGIIAYSRNGKPITTINHIISDLDLPVGMSIDGELYAHGYKLQQIVSWIKRKQEDTLKLKYHAYDLILPMPFEERISRLSDIKGNIEVVETWAVSNEDAIYEYHKQFRDEGYEGSIIRLNGYKYEDGKRSKSVLKLKDWQDAEYLVVDVVPSKDGWGILECKNGEGTFRVTAPGTMEDKMEVIDNKDYYIGKFVTVEYAYLTADGVPFHPIAKNWR